jgi:O-antigen/teichoic acid export membrane protein
MLNSLKKKYDSLLSDSRFDEILTGSVWALSGQIIATALGLVFSIIVARLYGADVVGIVSILNSFLMLATTFTVLGTSTSILRLIPEYLVKYSCTSAFKVYRKILFLVTAVSIGSGALFFFSAELIAGKIFSKPHLSFYFAIASAFVIFKSLTMLNTQAVRAIRFIRAFALMQAMPQGFNLLLLMLLTVFTPSMNAPIYSFLGSFALTGVAGFILIEYYFHKNIKPQDPVYAVTTREILSLSLPMLMAATMSFVIGETSVIVLGMFRTQAEVGYYAIAVKIASLTGFILNAVCSMAGSKFSELFHSNKMDELFYVAKKSAKLIFWTSVPILLCLIILGKIILFTFFGKEFVQAYPALVIIALGQLVNSISGATGLFLNMTGGHKVYRNIIFCACIVNIFLNIFLVPKFGITGAALAAMISLATWNIAIILYVKTKFGKFISYLPLISRV